MVTFEKFINWLCLIQPNCMHKKQTFSSACTKNKLLQVGSFFLHAQKTNFSLGWSFFVHAQKINFSLDWSFFVHGQKTNFSLDWLFFLQAGKPNIFNFRNHPRSKAYLHSYKGKFVYHAYHIQGVNKRMASPTQFTRSVTLSWDFLKFSIDRRNNQIKLGCLACHGSAQWSILCYQGLILDLRLNNYICLIFL